MRTNMSTADRSENKSALPATKSSGSEKYVLAIVIAGLIGLGIYQAFFCPDCYATADRTAVQSTTTEP